MTKLLRKRRYSFLDCWWQRFGVGGEVVRLLVQPAHVSSLQGKGQGDGRQREGCISARWLLSQAARDKLLCPSSGGESHPPPISPPLQKSSLREERLVVHLRRRTMRGAPICLYYGSTLISLLPQPGVEGGEQAAPCWGILSSPSPVWHCPRKPHCFPLQASPGLGFVPVQFYILSWPA